MVYIPIDKMLAALGVLIGLLLISMNVYSVMQFIDAFHFFFPGKQFSIWYVNLSYYKTGFIGLIYLIGGILLFLNKKAGWYISIAVSLFYSIHTLYYFAFISEREQVILDYLLLILILAINSLLLFLFKKSVRSKYSI